MVDYYIIPETCRGIAGRAEDIMLDRSLHFSKLQDAITGAMDACGSGRQVRGSGTGVMGEFSRFTEIGDTLFLDKIEPVHQDLCAHIDSSIGAFRDVIDAYVSGDIEQRVRAESSENNDVKLPIAEVRNPDGTVESGGGTVGTEPNTKAATEPVVDTGESDATSPFANHPGYEDNTP